TGHRREAVEDTWQTPCWARASDDRATDGRFRTTSRWRDLRAGPLAFDPVKRTSDQDSRGAQHVVPCRSPREPVWRRGFDLKLAGPYRRNFVSLRKAGLPRSAHTPESDPLRPCRDSLPA